MQIVTASRSAFNRSREATANGYDSITTRCPYRIGPVPPKNRETHRLIRNE